jgi:AcrR family transcriptional regulator
MKQQYHHGNLREALVQEAIHLLETEGLTGLSLRKTARGVGVSQAAPYSHFKDKQALLVAVCATGYAGNSTGPAYIAGLGRGYIHFALDNPGLFRLMFDGDMQELFSDFQDDPAFSEGYMLLDRGLAQFPIAYFEDDELSRAISWGVVHGLAHLLLGGRIKPKNHGYDDMDDFIRSTMNKFVGGVEVPHH